MKKIIISLLVLFVSIPVFSQFQNQQGGMMGQRGGMGQNRMRTPQSTVPLEVQKKNHEEKMEKRKKEFIANFMTTLEADAFQKEIIKQTIDDFFEEQNEFFRRRFARSIEQKDAYREFREIYFAELKSLISESDMDKINVMLDGDFKEDDDDDKKKKKKKKKRKKNKD